MHSHSRREESPAFTLIELLVVIAIIAILAAILFPVFAQARSKARQTTSLSNLKQQGLAMHMYAEDYEETNVPQWPFSACCGAGFDYDHTFHPYLNPYIKNKDIWKSPAAGSSVYVSKKIYGTSDRFGYDAALDGGYSMSYLMNETGWGNGNVSANYLGGGRTLAELTHPAEQIIIMEAAGTPSGGQEAIRSPSPSMIPMGPTRAAPPSRSRPIPTRPTPGRISTTCPAPTGASSASRRWFLSAMPMATSASSLTAM